MKWRVSLCRPHYSASFGFSCFNRMVFSFREFRILSCECFIQFHRLRHWPSEIEILTSRWKRIPIYSPIKMWLFFASPCSLNFLPVSIYWIFSGESFHRQSFIQIKKHVLEKILPFFCFGRNDSIFRRTQKKPSFCARRSNTYLLYFAKTGTGSSYWSM